MKVHTESDSKCGEAPPFPEIMARLEVAKNGALSAGALTLATFQDPHLRQESKQDRTIVTEADRAAETKLRQLIQSHFPQDSIVGEEFGITTGSTPWRWYLDPIDGTQAYARGVPLFGTLVGVTYDHVPYLGVIVMPALGEMVAAARGQGCHWTRGLRADGRGGWGQGETSLAKVSSVARLDEALFCTTWMQSFRDADCVDLFGDLCKATGVFRGWGDCYGYVLVATGRADLMVDPILEVWDAGPLPTIIEEAGGRYTTFDGSVDISGRSGIATNGLIHDAALRVIQKRT